MFSQSILRKSSVPGTIGGNMAWQHSWELGLNWDPSRVDIMARLGHPCRKGPDC